MPAPLVLSGRPREDWQEVVFFQGDHCCVLEHSQDAGVVVVDPSLKGCRVVQQHDHEPLAWEAWREYPAEQAAANKRRLKPAKLNAALSLRFPPVRYPPALSDKKCPPDELGIKSFRTVFCQPVGKPFCVGRRSG